VAVIKQLKGLASVMGTLREISDIVGLAPKAIREAVTIGLPSWDPPEEVPPRPPDQEAVDRVMEVIGMGTVEEKRAFERVIGSFRKITTGAPREPAREEEPRRLPAPAQEEAEREGA
jgi:hypothetical protein